MVKILICVQCLLVLILGYNVYKSKKETKRINLVVDKYLEMKSDNNNYQNVIAYFYQNENKTESNYWGRNEIGDSISLLYLAQQYKKLVVFKYKTSDCSNCINRVYEQLDSLTEKENLLIISDFTSFSLMKYLKGKYRNMLLLRVNEIGEINTPCLFQLDKNLNMTNYLYVSVNDKVLPSYIKELNNRNSL